MPVNVVSDFMGKDDLHLLWAELIHERVAEQNSPRSAHAGQGGIGLACLGAQMQTIDSLNAQSGAGHQLLKTLRERGVVDGSDFVKKRQQKYRDQSAQNQRN